MQFMLFFASQYQVGAPEIDMPAWQSYFKTLGEAGIIVSAARLNTVETATTVRVKDGARLVEDGPFADTREKLGGYVVIDVADLDAAIDWAGKCPGAKEGRVEVRPVLMTVGG
jgi:hypothetical protein